MNLGIEPHRSSELVIPAPPQPPAGRLPRFFAALCWDWLASGWRWYRRAEGGRWGRVFTRDLMKDGTPFGPWRFDKWRRLPACYAGRTQRTAEAVQHYDQAKRALVVTGARYSEEGGECSVGDCRCEVW